MALIGEQGVDANASETKVDLIRKKYGHSAENE
jgi:hypothetical protein